MKGNTFIQACNVTWTLLRLPAHSSGSILTSWNVSTFVCSRHFSLATAHMTKFLDEKKNRRRQMLLLNNFQIILVDDEWHFTIKAL